MTYSNEKQHGNSSAIEKGTDGICDCNHKNCPTEYNLLKYHINFYGK